ncbi:MAG: chorismate lyase [Halomonas sp.]|uniref:chorismate--pyruvate lyase family protein n=1 Tax=unclassified Halomonas TaxID=2609666 RepID=UPI00099058F5|nr:MULTISPECIES: chorismate lyase [unclassified Halomonas]AQU84414.1 chorismate lyase [Halomonas sp. 'Soap Lake \
MTVTTFRHAHPFPHWLPVNALRPAMSASWWQWVASTDSLTARLTAAAGSKPFRVRLLRQVIGLPLRDEAQALGIEPRRNAWIREVALCVDDTPWVVARSVAPLTQLQGKGLEGLGERSLGSWLFRQPDLVRGPLYATRHWPSFAYHLCTPADTGVWGRRSVFQHSGLSLLVQEYFLSTMADELSLPSR